MTVSFGTRAQATAATSFAPSRAIPPASASRPTMKPVMFCRNSSGTPRWSHSSTKCAALRALLAEQDALVGEDADRVAVDVGEAADDRRRVERLELVPARAVDDPRDDLARVIAGARAGRHDAEQPAGIDGRLGGLDSLPRRGRARAERRDDRAHDLQRIGVVFGEVVDDARAAGVQVAAAELLRRHLLARRRLHERRAGEEDRPLLAHDHGLVAHRRDVRAAGRARAHDGGDLGDARGRHRRLVEEDAPEVLAVGEDLVLHRQVGAAGVDEVDAGQAVVPARSPARAGAS